MHACPAWYRGLSGCRVVDGVGLSPEATLGQGCRGRLRLVASRQPECCRRATSPGRTTTCVVSRSGAMTGRGAGEGGESGPRAHRGGWIRGAVRVAPSSGRGGGLQEDALRGAVDLAQEPQGELAADDRGERVGG